jgi:enoyl-CoA hydratase/carnithine racemase
MTPTDAHTVDVEVHDAHAQVTLVREHARNALSPSLLQQLEDALRVVTAAGCRVVTFRGQGPALSAGADLPHLRSLLGDSAAIDDYLTHIGRVFDAIEAAPFVSVCVVDGYAVAGGCELMLACDLAIAADEARIGDRHLEYGLLPGAGGSVRLSQALPAPLARRLLYTGEVIDGRTAAEWGLVGWSVPRAELDGAVAAIVTRLLRHSPVALAVMKRLHAGVCCERRQALDAERDEAVQHLLHSEDVREGLAAFAAKRSPHFSGTATASTAGRAG